MTMPSRLNVQTNEVCKLRETPQLQSMILANGTEQRLKVMGRFIAIYDEVG